MIKAMGDDAFYKRMLSINIETTDEKVRTEFATKLLNTDTVLRSYITRQLPKGSTKQEQIEFLLENF